MSLATSDAAFHAADESLLQALNGLEIALPPKDETLDQDEEWVVVKVDGQWKKIRLHDYHEVFAVQGLYERWIYQIFRCNSPKIVRELVGEVIENKNIDSTSMRVLDLGAGNGCVAEEFNNLGIKTFCGIDIHPEAEEAAHRDRPGLYDDYIVGDLTNLDDDQEDTLSGFDADALTCVAALGFGDIPPEVFDKAFDAVKPGGLIAFTIKTDFLDAKDTSGFSKRIRELVDSGLLRIEAKRSYLHRIDAGGNELTYLAIVGMKTADA